MSDFRIEKDTMGEMKIPNTKLYGASTQRAVENFPVSGRTLPVHFNRTLALLKKCAALANLELKKLSPELSRAIVSASEEVISGKYDDHFVVDIYQTGSGTSTNMNANELISNIANLKVGELIGTKKPVHPNDHVNMGQSSNDIIPTAIHVSVLTQIDKHLIPALEKLAKSLEMKAFAFKEIVKTGRTHLQDATPLTLGQEFSGYAQAVKNSIRTLKAVYPPLEELAIGGTAVGTGINTHPKFAATVCVFLNRETRLHFTEAPNHFESQATKDGCVVASSALKSVAVTLLKIANDIRFLGSGPRAGYAEINLPEVQPGSSIMPGKVNPVIAESVIQVAVQVLGYDVSIGLAGASGNFELNVMMPLIVNNLLEGVELLGNATTIFREKCINGITANKEKCEESIERGLMLTTALAPVLGYDKAAQIAKTAFKKNKTIREVVLEEGLLSKEELDKILDPKKMLKPE